MAMALSPVGFADLAGFAGDDWLAAFQTFQRSAEALTKGVAATRPGVPPSPALLEIAGDAVSAGIADAGAARGFFERRFRPYRVRPDNAAPAGFLTGYYEPRLRGSLTPSVQFAAPILARPRDLVTFDAGARPPGFDPALSGAQRLVDGALRPYPERDRKSVV